MRTKALAHFKSRFVGKGDGGNGFGRYAAVFQQAGDPADQRFCFSPFPDRPVRRPRDRRTRLPAIAARSVRKAGLRRPPDWARRRPPVCGRAQARPFCLMLWGPWWQPQAPGNKIARKGQSGRLLRGCRLFRMRRRSRGEGSTSPRRSRRTASARHAPPLCSISQRGASRRMKSSGPSSFKRDSKKASTFLEAGVMPMGGSDDFPEGNQAFEVPGGGRLEAFLSVRKFFHPVQDAYRDFSSADRAESAQLAGHRRLLADPAVSVPVIVVFAFLRKKLDGAQKFPAAGR